MASEAPMYIPSRPQICIDPSLSRPKKAKQMSPEVTKFFSEFSVLYTKHLHVRF